MDLNKYISNEIKKISFSKEVLKQYKLLLNIEFLLLLVYFIIRTKHVVEIKQALKGPLGGALSISDFENGWTFVMIFLLAVINTFLYQNKVKSIYWSLKISLLFSLIFLLTGSTEYFINFTALSILGYHLRIKVRNSFQISKSNLLFHCITGIIIIILIFYLDFKFEIIKYY